MTAELLQYFCAITLSQWLWNEIADTVRKQRVSPEHLYVCRLVCEVWLVSQHNGHQPIRVVERHQSAGASLIAAELIRLVEECGVLQCDGERLPTRLRDAAVESRRVAKLRRALRQFFPERPTAAISFGQLSRRAGHRTEARGVGHRAVLHEDKVAVFQGKQFIPASSPSALGSETTQLLNHGRQREV